MSLKNLVTEWTVSGAGTVVSFITGDGMFLILAIGIGLFLLLGFLKESQSKRRVRWAEKRGQRDRMRWERKHRI